MPDWARKTFTRTQLVHGPKQETTRSLRGLLAKCCTAPSAAEIDQNRAEMFANSGVPISDDRPDRRGPCGHLVPVL
jgi:hypothetical protein